MNSLYKTTYRVVIIALSLILPLHAEGMITLYLQKPAKKIASSLRQEGLLTLQHQDPSTLPLSGFFCIYGGYCDYSDNDGLINFPLRHTAPKIYLLITRTISMETIKPHTISHRALPAGTPAKLYVFEKKEDSKEGYHYWETREEELPEDGKINDITLIIITNPDNLYVPLGKRFIPAASAHLTMPSIYVIGDKELDTIALETTDLKKFLEPVSLKQKQSVKKKLIRRKTSNS